MVRKLDLSILQLKMKTTHTIIPLFFLLAFHIFLFQRKAATLIPTLTIYACSQVFNE